MIAIDETLPAAAEAPLFLPLATDPINTGVTAHSWHDVGDGTTDELLMKLPSGNWSNVLISQIVEKGFGRYCVRLTSSQTMIAGLVYLRSVVSGAQPFLGSEEIGNGSGDVQTGDSTARFPFFLPNSTNPSTGVAGHAFVTGEIKICVPGGSYVNADVARVNEIGNGAYELLLTAAQVASRGKVFLYVSVSGAQRFEDYLTVLTSGVSASTTTPTVDPVPNPTSPTSLTYVDHVAAALNRLPSQFRS